MCEEGFHFRFLWQLETRKKEFSIKTSLKLISQCEQKEKEEGWAFLEPLPGGHPSASRDLSSSLSIPVINVITAGSARTGKKSLIQPEV